jgi:hypothetical protein
LALSPIMRRATGRGKASTATPQPPILSQTLAETDRHFDKHSSPNFEAPGGLQGKFNPYVSDSFILNSSACCFVRAVSCPSAFCESS